MKRYDHKGIERKWQKIWASKGIFKTADAKKNSDNFYLLTEFPYPSGNLHVGHWYAFAVPDILARALRMQGKNVLYPIGFDAFGLPAENAAIKNKLNPKKWTYANIAYMKKQIVSMGASFDWSREVITADPTYYKWTQWQFLQLFKKGLAYQKETAVNWCPKDKTVLANEQVVGGKCERCDSIVEQKMMLQWNIKITDYADRLIDDLEPLDWPKEIKESQRNWIGRSEGAEIDFRLPIDTMKHVVILHSRGGTPDSDFIPWVKDELEKLGYTVEVPMLPNNTEPDDIEQSKYIAKNCTIDENTIIVGHSSGGLAAMRLLEKTKGGRLVLVGTPHNSVFADGKERASVSRSINRGYDYGKIRSNVRDVIALYDSGDPIIPLSDGKAYAEKLGGIYIEGKGTIGHFNGDKEPDVLMAITPTLRVFTTRPDTLFGATYLVLAPEHPWIALVLTHCGLLTNEDEIGRYIALSKRKTELERLVDQKEKTGVKLDGVEAINPATGEKIPVFVADYVLATYGTGAIMAVPAHDERDFAFAKKFDLSIKNVIRPATLGFGPGGNYRSPTINESHENVHVYSGIGELMDSGEFNGLSGQAAKIAITERFGRKKTTYKLRDWIVSRQRYWGVPIPIIHCKKCGAVAVLDKDLPVKLPEVKDYLPEGSGKSPLAKVKTFVDTVCPKCCSKAMRETDTLDTFIDSSWHFLRYTDPKNTKEFASKKKMMNWMPVDLYSGGAEHTTMHLLYSRFWHKALFDLGLVDDHEPYRRRMNRSLILGPDGQKMSKSRGNVIDPDAIVAQLGADTVRMYLAFIGPYNEASSYPWNPDGVVGARRFLERVWRVGELVQKTDVSELTTLLHKTIKKVGDDIAAMKFNTAISQLMILLNEIEKQKKISTDQWATLLKLLAPFAPHMTEELWALAKHKSSIHTQEWPVYDPQLLQDATVTIMIQINGKTRGEIIVSSDADKATVEAKAREAMTSRMGGKSVTRTIVVPGRLINFVLEEKL